MFTTDELGLLEAIHADPRNDAPRMAYADWLHAHDSPASVLIRWQLETKATFELYVNPESLGLFGPFARESALIGGRMRTVGREHEVLDNNRFGISLRWIEDFLAKGWISSWFTPFPEEGRWANPQATMRRGVPDINWSPSFISTTNHLDNVLAKLPPHLRLRSLILDVEELESSIDSILSHPAMKRINTLSISLDYDTMKETLHFIERFADTNLPELVSAISVLPRYPLPTHGEHIAEDEHIIQILRQTLGGRMEVRTRLFRKQE